MDRKLRQIIGVRTNFMKLANLDTVALLAALMVSYDIALSGGDELACVDVVYSAGGLMTSCATVLVVVGTGVLIGEGLIGAGLKANLSPTIRG